MDTATTPPDPELRDILVTDDSASHPAGLPLDLLSQPLRGQVDWVQRRYGLDPATACLATLVSVVCACGPGHRVLNPVDDSFLPPTLGVVFHGDAMHLCAAVNLSLEPLRRWLLAQIGSPDKREMRRARLRLADLHRERTHLELQLGKGEPEPAAFRFGAPDPPEASKLREQTRARLESILGDIEATTFLLLPHVLADDAPVAQLLTPGHLALDGSLLAASLSGDAMTTWSSATKPEKTALAQLLSLSWRGWPRAGDEQTHARPLLSAALVTDGDGARSLWKDQGLAGVNRHLFFVGHAGEAAFDLDAIPADDAQDFCGSALQTLIDARLEGRVVNHAFNEAATTHFQAFLNETLAEAKGLAADERLRWERTPMLALKLALLVHVVSLGQGDEVIDMPAVEFACRLTAVVRARDRDFIRQAITPVLAPNGSATAMHDDDKLSDIVEKLKLRGPLHWRKLLRTGHVQKEAPLRKLLVKGMEAGLVRREGDFFSAAESLPVP